MNFIKEILKLNECCFGTEYESPLVEVSRVFIILGLSIMILVSFIHFCL